LEGEGVAANEEASAVAPWASELFSRAARIAFITAIPSEPTSSRECESAGGHAGLLREISRGGIVLGLLMVRLFYAKTHNRIPRFAGISSPQGRAAY
jgi:hypothetical protein